MCWSLEKPWHVLQWYNKLLMWLWNMLLMWPTASIWLPSQERTLKSDQDIRQLTENTDIHQLSWIYLLEEIVQGIKLKLYMRASKWTLYHPFRSSGSWDISLTSWCKYNQTDEHLSSKKGNYAQIWRKMGPPVYNQVLFDWDWCSKVLLDAQLVKNSTSSALRHQD